MPKKYTERQLIDAVNEVRQGTLSLRKASSKYGVPVMTIQDRIKGKVDDIATRGRPTVLPHHVEEHLVGKLKDAASKGFGITRRLLAVQVGRLTKRLKMTTPFRNGVPGKDWVTGFLKRHPDLSVRTPTALSTVRARMLNATVAEKYFSDLGERLKYLNISDKPHLLWNIDETSVPLTHNPCKVIAETGVKNIPGRVGNNRENVSVMACVNAAGYDIPPFAIVKGKTHKSLYAYNTKEGIPGSVYTYQERAWMEDTLGVLWFKNHFLKHCGHERPQVIMLDSHSSHETLGLIEAARENNITLFAFPPHTTQWLCPLDKSVFGPLSREYSRVCSEFMTASPNNLVTKWEWPKLFGQAYRKAFSQSNIVNGFKKCGIYPFCPAAIPQNAVSPSLPFDNRMPATHVPCATPLSAVAPDPSVKSSSSALHVPIESSATSASTSQCLSPDKCLAVAPFTPTVNCSQEHEPAMPYDIVSEQEFIGSVLSGNVDFVTDENGTIQVQLPVGDDVSMGLSVSDILTENAQHTSSNMICEIDDLFHLQTPVREEKKSIKKITSHRILTSDEIFTKKSEIKIKKEKELKEKEDRKQVRLAKAKAKASNKKNK